MYVGVFKGGVANFFPRAMRAIMIYNPTILKFLDPSLVSHDYKALLAQVI